MKSIHQLVPDIYSLVESKDEDSFTQAFADELSFNISRRLIEKFRKEEKRNTLRLSKLGTNCPCALWYSVRHPEMAQAVPPWAEIKFSYGHILEALAISLAKAAGHSVTGEQDELYVDDIKGHRDCVIDGCIVDVKSASTLSFKKFKTGTLKYNDSFGYLEQLDGYLAGSLDDPLVTMKDKAYILAIDKQLGHMCIYEHEFREEHIRQRIREYKRIVEGSVPPKCTCETRDSGGSGNVELGVTASYSSYKWQCFPQLRCFLYAEGPKYLTKVVRRPADHIVEIDKLGNIVYN